MKQKWWWHQTNNINDEGINMVWTQLKQEFYFNQQQKNQLAEEVLEIQNYVDPKQEIVDIYEDKESMKG